MRIRLQEFELRDKQQRQQIQQIRAQLDTEMDSTREHQQRLDVLELIHSVSAEYETQQVSLTDSEYELLIQIYPPKPFRTLTEEIIIFLVPENFFGLYSMFGEAENHCFELYHEHVGFEVRK